MNPSDAVLWEAEFNPKVKTYWLLNGAIILTATLVGVVLLPIWFLVGNYFTGRYLDRMKCTLTERSLEVGKGLFVRVEKTVPLDKITDIGLVHGPIMRYLGIQAISVETAGQSSAGALVRMHGIKSTEGFRRAVLDQRDKVAAALGSASRGTATLKESEGQSEALLADIRDTLVRIEGKLTKE